jgi:glycolate oxidase FAD binding subunit
VAAESIPGPLAGACGEVRLGGPADSVARVRPRYVAAPADTAEASAVLRAAAELGLAVAPRGAGTRLDWGAPPDRCELLVDTRRMAAVLEHAAGDLVARVQAGVGLRHLADVLGAAGQRLALDPPSAGREPGADTVGGLIATGVAGPLRLRYGTPRDLLIGITVVRADGTVARSGGKVVKNVAGYDLGKLFAGSYGTLGLVTEAAFRLHPRPQAVAYITRDGPDPETAQAVLAGAVDSPLAPSAAELHWPGRDAPISAGVLLEGDQEGVAERAARMRGLLDGATVDAQPPSWWGADAGDGTVLRVAFFAGELSAVLAAIAAAGAAAGIGQAVGGSAAAGVLHVAVPTGAAPAAVAEFVTAIRATLSRAPALAGLSDSGQSGVQPARGSVVVLHAPAAVRDLIDLWGPVPSLPLMRAVKDQFDPEHRMAPGRFAGGI